VSWASITSKDVRGGGSTTTQPYALPHMRSSPFVGRFFPRSNVKWTLQEVRRHLQQILLQRIGWCPLCARPVDGRSPPRAPSRM
jgi:hypothetical protein